MTTTFLSSDIWPQLEDAARTARVRCAVAVAYFGAGASKLLPLPKGSHLVIDASDGAVKCGQTCPADLLKMVERGVTVFSVPNLHAKVFVLGRTAFIGSTNASNRSASQLVEAVIRTTEPGAVGAAREFVSGLCLHELTPEVLKRLDKLYVPPRIVGGKREKKPSSKAIPGPAIPRLLLIQTSPVTLSESEQAIYDAGLPFAEKRRRHPRGFELDSFRTDGRRQYAVGDIVVQVIDEGNSNVLVSPPGNVLYVRSRKDRKPQVCFVYLERPSRNRRRLNLLARALKCSPKLLQRDGVIRDMVLGRALLNYWATSP